MLYSRPNGWTDWAEIFCGYLWVAGGCYRLKKSKIFFLKFFFPKALQLVNNNTLKHNNTVLILPHFIYKHFVRNIKNIDRNFKMLP